MSLKDRSGYRPVLCPPVRASRLINLLSAELTPPRPLLILLLYEEQYYLCISNSLLENRFSCEERDAILSAPSAQISDFVRCPFLSTRYTDFLTSIFKKCCEDNNAVPQMTVETSSIMTRLSLCASGLGVMFLSKSLYQQATSIFQQEILDAIRFIPLSYQPEPIYRQLGINYLTQRGLTPVEQSFIDTAKKALMSRPSLMILETLLQSVACDAQECGFQLLFRRSLVFWRRTAILSA